MPELSRERLEEIVRDRGFLGTGESEILAKMALKSLTRAELLERCYLEGVIPMELAEKIKANLEGE